MSTGNKRRRAATDSASRTPSTTIEVNTDKASLARLNELLSNALKIAKSIKPQRGDGPAIRQAQILANSLLKSIPVDLTTKAIRYRIHKSSLENAVNALQKHVKRDRDNYEAQGDMMGKINRELLEWLPDLWRLMAEVDADLKLIQQSLVLCSETVDNVVDCNSRWEYFDVDCNVTITGSNEVIYESSGDIKDTLAWMWRELLIHAASKNYPTKAILADIQTFNLTERVFQLIRRFDAEGKLEEDESEEDNFWDAHWSDGMHDSAAQILAERHQGHIALFEASPSFGLFNTLISESPDLKTPLLEFVRSQTLGTYRYLPDPNAPSVASGEAAAHIFIKESLTEDLIRLIDGLPSWSQPSQATQRDIVKYLSTQRSKVHRARGLKILEKGLRDIQGGVWQEAEHVFPGLNEATDWLEDEIENGEWSSYPPPKICLPWNAESRKLNTLINEFVDLASHYPGGDPGPLHRGKDSDSDDSDSKRPEKNENPNIVRPIQQWIKLLGEWPNKSEAAAVWEKVRNKEDDEPVFVVHGVEEKLAARCGWDYDRRNYAGYQFLADGIKATVKTFACKNLTELEKYTPKTTSHGIISISTDPSY